ncbi:tetratricopeptide repeat-containing serine protease family protein [Pseudomonas cavernicola]|uniref:tetratricopeptide repeat-containing S1 family peptidase n=1 Tax=Pseudomonas cavernicola TaxID=2320866 RepID=UPI001EE5FEEC|nr:tetratricopeptide repeat-containing serine protease family protein [Pseudomonas cavernicola]
MRVGSECLTSPLMPPNNGTRGFLLVVFCLFAFDAYAKTASEVFDAVSPSVIVIRTFDAQGKALGLGSGVALGGGMVATNCHVLAGAEHMRVQHRKREYPAALRHSDWDRDVCTLAVNGLKAAPVTLGSTARLKVGARVYAIGAPRGLELTLSEGIISSLRPVAGGQYLQITAPLSPGSSGGGLFDEQGRLIGLPTFYLAEGQQLNFAVPVEWISELPKRHKSTEETTQTPYLDWLNKAAALQVKQDWAGLLNHARRWTKAQPQAAVAWHCLGFAYGKSGQSAKAIEAYRQAVRINPEYAEAWYNLGVVYGKSGQTTSAIEAYQQAVRIDPEDADVWNNLGAVYGDSGQIAKAIEAFQQAVRINPEFAKAWLNLGVVYGDSGQIAKAIEAFQQAVRINPEYAKAWLNLGGSYGKSGQTAKAIEAYRQAVRIDPEDAEAWYSLGVAYRLSGQAEQTLAVYKRLKALDPARAEQFLNENVLP